MGKLFTSAKDCVTPIFTTGGSGQAIFSGTAFSLWDEFYWITAEHCIRGKEAGDVFVTINDELRGIKNIFRHQHADIAILQLDGGFPINRNFFRTLASSGTEEFEFRAYGFPENTIGPNEGKIICRHFRGYYLRIYPHNSHLGYQYQAAELNIGCPAGLSGGPIYTLDSNSAVCAMVCENTYASTLLESIELSEGERDNTYNVLNYGVALLLDPLRSWISDIIPKRN